MLQVYNRTRSRTIVTEGRVAASFTARLVGLIGTRELPAGSGLLITPCNSVHCLFMSIAIDVIYLDKEGKVVHIDENLRPWRLSRPQWRAHSVLEVPAGTVAHTGTQVGDQLEVQQQP